MFVHVGSPGIARPTEPGRRLEEARDFTKVKFMYYLYVETLIHSFDILHVHGRHARGIVDHENCSLDYVHVDELARPPILRQAWRNGILCACTCTSMCVITWTCREMIRRPCKYDYIPLAHIQVDPLPRAQPT